jgi:hypothetical protein
MNLILLRFKVANLAEGVRFELTRPFGLALFKSARFNHSRTPPYIFASFNQLFSK